MKIKSINTYHLRAPLDVPFGFSQFYYSKRENLLVEIMTADGISGWGECLGPPAPIQASLKKHMEHLITGENCLNHELIWHKLWTRYMDWSRYGVFIAALSGIDIALWDLKGKVYNQPLYRLLGGTAHEQIPCYATGHYFRDLKEDMLIECIIDEANTYRTQGFDALKFKIGKNIDFDKRLLRIGRKEFPGVSLMADANHAYSYKEALLIGRILDEYDYRFFEEPLAPHAREDCARLRNRLETAIATGESEQTRFGFRRLIESEAADIIQPDLTFCGGVSEGIKIRTLANSHGVDVTPHAWGTWIGFAAALHFHATNLPNPGRMETTPIPLECDNSEHPIKSECFIEKVVIKDGFARLPQEPGLGIEVDKKKLEKFVVA